MTLLWSKSFKQKLLKESLDNTTDTTSLDDNPVYLVDSVYNAIVSYLNKGGRQSHYVSDSLHTFKNKFASSSILVLLSGKSRDVHIAKDKSRFSIKLNQTNFLVRNTVLVNPALNNSFIKCSKQRKKQYRYQIEQSKKKMQEYTCSSSDGKVLNNLDLTGISVQNKSSSSSRNRIKHLLKAIDSK